MIMKIGKANNMMYHIVSLTKQQNGEWEPNPDQVIATVKLENQSVKLDFYSQKEKYEKRLQELFSKPSCAFTSSAISPDGNTAIDAGLIIAQPWEPKFVNVISDKLFNMGLGCILAE